MKSSGTVPVAANTVSGALVGVGMWALDTYAFPAGTPGVLQVAVPIILVGAFGWVGTLWAHRHVMNTEIKALVKWNAAQRGTPGGARNESDSSPPAKTQPNPIQPEQGPTGTSALPH